MPDPLGYSFAPTFENAEIARARRDTARPQEALRVLSYRLPRVTGAQSLSPLLGSQPSGAGPNTSVLESVFKTILGPEAAETFLSGQQAGAPPSPKAPVVHPGTTGPGQLPDLQPVDFLEMLRRRTGGNTGIGDTGHGGSGPLQPTHGNPFAEMP